MTCQNPATFVVYDEDADKDGRMTCDYHLPEEIRSRPVLTVSVFNVQPPAPGYNCEDGSPR
jgi:hypothetical protein